MSEAFEYVPGEELNIEVPTSDRWLRHGARLVRAFVRVPSAGINDRTGVMVFLHGIGGRQNDVSWKVMRRSAADRYNVLAIGVNFMGTELFEEDKAFVHAQFLSFMPRIHQWPEHWPEKDESGQRTFQLNPEQYYYYCNKAAALQAGLAVPEVIWDWGLFQALDVLNVLNALRAEEALSALNWRRCHLLGASAGGQVAHMLLKLAPQTFCSLLDLGGVVYVEEMQHHLTFALKDLRCRAVDNDSIGGHTGANINNEFLLVATRRTGSARFDAGLTNGLGLQDELDVRTISGVLGDGGEQRLEHLVCLQGRDDNVVPVALKQRIVEGYQRRGSKGRLVVVGQDVEVDGVLFETCDHSFYKSIRGIMEQFGDAVFHPEVMRQGGGDLGASQTRRFPSCNGFWELDLGVVAQMRFVRDVR